MNMFKGWTDDSNGQTPEQEHLSEEEQSEKDEQHQRDEWDFEESSRCNR